MPMGDYGAYQAPAKKKVIKKRPEDMGRGKKVTVVKKTVSKKVAPPMRKAIPGFGGYSAANISSSRTGANANHSQRSASQVIRSRDTELRGRPKPAYKTK